MTTPDGYNRAFTASNHWPGLVCSYEIIPAKSPQLALQLKLQVDKYLPSASVSSARARAAAADDLDTYRQIQQELQQLSFALETSLNSAAIAGDPPLCPIDPATPFTAFGGAAYRFLHALQSLQQFVYTCAGTETVAEFFETFAVTPEQLFAANADQAYRTLFGDAQLSVPTTELVAPQETDTLRSFALNNKVTTDELARHNRTAIFAADAPLEIPSLVFSDSPKQYPIQVAAGTETVAELAEKFSPLDAVALVTLNQRVPGLLVSGITISIQSAEKTVSVVTGPAETFKSLLEKFAAAGAALSLVELTPEIAAQRNLLQKDGVWICTGQYSSYAARSGDLLEEISGKYPNLTPALLAILNHDLPGLLAPGQTINDPHSNNSITTANADSFDSLLDKFRALGVTLSLAELVSELVAQKTLVQPLGVWTTPPMVAAKRGADGTGPTLAGLATTYNLNMDALARANACVQGFLAGGVTVTHEGISFVTSANETLNSLTKRYQHAGLVVNVSDLAAAFANVDGLLNPASFVVPLPAATQASLDLMAPTFSDAIFPLTVRVFMRRGLDGVRTPIVSEATPFVNNGNNESLADFATKFEAALPGLHLASGEIEGEVEGEVAGDTVRRLWVVNFRSSLGPQIHYQFAAGDQLQCFAVPPLSTSLVSGAAPITRYVSGAGLTGPPEAINFESIDLDAWASTFLQAVDLFLDQFPAGALQTTPGVEGQLTPSATVVAQKELLAQTISGRVEALLQPSGPIDPNSLPEAQAILKQALLAKLSSAYAVSTVVQLPVEVQSNYEPSQARHAPCLAGQFKVAGDAAHDDDFSLSPANFRLVNGTNRAASLFAVKSPADNQQARLTLRFVVNQVEVPATGAAMTVAEQASHRLTFVRPLPDQDSAVGEVTIPIPLRSYPTPATLIEQLETQSYLEPKTATELQSWDYSFVYQHPDAAQDATCLKLQFYSGGRDLTEESAEPLLFAALAQFVTVYPRLQDDLAVPPPLTTEPTDNAALVAMQTFSRLVEQVVKAWTAPDATPHSSPRPAADLARQTYEYKLRGQKSDATSRQLARLLVIADANNPSALWPEVEVYLEGEFQKLTMATPPAGSREAGYVYPPGVLADSSGQHRITFPHLNVSNIQEVTAGTSVVRNAGLVQTAPTNPNFIYQTPLTSFADVVIPFIYGGVDLDIKVPPAIDLAQALGQFFETLLSCNPDLPAGTTRKIRVACNYGYQLTASAAERVSEQRPTTGSRVVGDNHPLVTFLPVTLISDYPFDLSHDYNWHDPESFVSRLAELVNTWRNQTQPPATGGAFFFDLSLFFNSDPADDPANQPAVLEAPFLRYALNPSVAP